jgi:phosphoenolpyruvate phosphomutase
MVIYANQGMRAAVRAMQNVFSGIIQSGHTSEIESIIVSMGEVFALQGIEG